MYNEIMGVDSMRLLIVEDHQKINDLLTTFARQDQHEVIQARNAEDAMKALSKQSFDVIITDLMLPDMQGEELIAKIRANSDVYIMVISAKIDVPGRIDVLSLGADDYVTKPFSVEEVMAKLKNVAKRVVVHQPIIHAYNHGSLKIYPLSREVVSFGVSVTLTKYEYNVLWQLASHPSKIYSRDELLETCFDESEAFDRVIDVYIKNIRKKLNDESANPSCIKTHYGLGYQFVGKKDD